VVEDANAGRSWIMPTALTAPAGTWAFTDWELLIVGASYSITDHLDLSAATIIPVVSNQPFFGLLAAKYQVLKQGSLRVALHGSFEFVGGYSSTTTSSTGTVTTSNSAGGIGTVGGVATLCLDAPCHSHLSGYLAAGFATSGQSAVPLVFAGSAAIRVARHVKLIGEVDSAAVLGNNFNSFADGFLFWYGLRFTSHNIGVDLGFMEPVSKQTTTDSMGNVTSSWQVGLSGGALPLGVPFLSFTYRG
jgi:hypothetical protein